MGNARQIAVVYAENFINEKTCISLRLHTYIKIFCIKGVKVKRLSLNQCFIDPGLLKQSEILEKNVSVIKTYYKII